MTAIGALIYKQRVGKLVLVDSAGLGRTMTWFLRLESVSLLRELLQLPIVRTPKRFVKSIFYSPILVDDPIVQELISIGNDPAAKKAVLKAVRSGISLWGVGRQRKWDTRGGRKTREIWGGVSSLDEVEYFR